MLMRRAASFSATKNLTSVVSQFGWIGFVASGPRSIVWRALSLVALSFEDRQDLLGHRSGRITTHYSAVELGRLIDAAASVCEQNGTRPELVVMRGHCRATPAKLPQKSWFVPNSS